MEALKNEIQNSNSVKKTFFYILLIFIVGLNVYSQSADIEIENVTNKFKKGEISQEEYTNQGKIWRDVIKSVGGYPELPFNSQTGRIEYAFTYEYPNLTKEEIFKRILEWTSINFGSLDAVLNYSDKESGKIILKGFFNVSVIEDYETIWGNRKQKPDTKKCNQIYIFTIKENKLKLEITGINYDFIYGGFTTGSYYVPESTVNMSIHALYPITNSPPVSWKGYLSILSVTNIEILQTANAIDLYLKNTHRDYEF